MGIQNAINRIVFATCMYISREIKKKLVVTYSEIYSSYGFKYKNNFQNSSKNRKLVNA